MKTIEELYNEVIASDELKKEFLSLKSDQIEGFAKAHGCDATLDEIKAFFTAKKGSGELSDDELDQVVGGKAANLAEATYSLITFGAGCAFEALTSVIEGRCGTAIKGDKMLCETDKKKE